MSKFITSMVLCTFISISAPFLVGCPKNTPQPTPPTKTVATLSPTSASRLVLARHSTHFLKVEGAISSPSRLIARIDSAPAIRISAFSLRAHRSTSSSPLADQLLATPQIVVDAGSYLAPLSTDASGAFQITTPMPIWLRIDVPSTADSGPFKLHILQEPITPTPSQNLPTQEQTIPLTISDIVYPTEPRILAAATTTIADLSRLFPLTFGTLNAGFLDRADPDHADAVRQLDALVQAAQFQGLALFVEDLAPVIKVDDVGKVTVDWDSYDRIMTPYMEGSAFADRIPYQVWIAPIPPRRIRDEPTQLRQYLASCVEHYLAKGWIATPAFMHPALVEAVGENADPVLREKISTVLKMHLSKDVLAVSTPDAVIPHPRLWVIDDTDPRLPPAGALATEESIRVWPWTCAARGAKGFVWRNAVESVDSLAQLESPVTIGSGRRPLLIVQTPPKNDPTPVAVLPSLRLAWLNAGLNDTNMLGLLERRGDPAVVSEVLAGVVGRTGLTVAVPSEPGDLPLAPAGFLYSAWPADHAAWQRLPALLEMLVSSTDLGHRAKISPSDPLYLATKLWLAETHRPVVRIAGYRFAQRPGREGPITDIDLELLVENPLNTRVDLEFLLENLPGDFQLTPGAPGINPLTPNKRLVTIEPSALTRVRIPLAGHIDTLRKTPQPHNISIRELTGGATIQLPLLLPIYRVRPLDANAFLTIDGKPDDWTLDVVARDYGPMLINSRYLSRAELLRGRGVDPNPETLTLALAEDPPATVRWSHDAANIYALITCPQPDAADEKNNDWPQQSNRWWGTDGVQLLLTSGNTLQNKRLIHLGIKPSGVVLTLAATLAPNTASTSSLKWTDGPSGLKFGITSTRSAYTVELAIPRSWFPHESQFRVNLLRHRAADLRSTSWSGPVVDDTDISLMGLLVTE